ncbi:MAG: hypothetical protein JST06_10390 [Bacteroidetes bacterium]|nr:hypothetical protein [Bacteroidota bacterium]MBS1630123.1 hypothetical protein [Bacteroidota bacterium]
MKILYAALCCLLLASCAGGWTEGDKSQLRQECMSQSVPQIGEQRASTYCNCFVEQMVKQYPVFNDMMERYQADTIEKLKKHCRKEIGLP